MRADENSALIFNQQRLSNENGPGLRSVLYLKGCSLSCSWCHNPESISPAQQIWHLSPRCIGCGSCAKACPERAIKLKTLAPEGCTHLDISATQCTGCQHCVEACPAKALVNVAKRWTVSEAMHYLEKDRAFYRASGGGITLSGGEPMLQPGFVCSVLKACQMLGIGTAVDTCGDVPLKHFQQIAPYTDVFLFDVKLLDAKLHKQATGKDNQRIMANLTWLIEHCTTQGKALWIRTPLIPGLTNTEHNLKAIANWLARHDSDCIQRWELCAFNNSCAIKYQRLGQRWQFQNTPLLTDTQKSTLERLSKDFGSLTHKIHITGMFRHNSTTATHATC